MVRQLLGNIRGPRGERGLQGTQGPQGPKGDDGGFNGEKVDVNNLLELSKAHLLNNESDVITDLKTGSMSSTGSWSIEVPFKPENKVYYFRVEDYDSNPGYYAGRLRLSVRKSNNDYIFDAISVLPGTVYTVDLRNADLSGTSSGTVVRFGFTNATPYNVKINKPMLTETEFPAVWNPSLEDRQGYLHGWLRGDITGLQATPSDVRIATVDSTLTVDDDNNVLLEPGLWAIHLNVYLSPVNYDSGAFVTIFHNDNQVALLTMQGTSQKRGSLSHVMNVKSGDRVSVKSYKLSSGGDVGFGATANNTINIYKVGV